MSKFKVGFIGTGRVPEKPSVLGYAMAYRHAEAYKALPDDCEMVACADIVEENAQAFAARYGIAHTYTDYHQMLQNEELDIVSICTWPKLHAEMTIACCLAGVPAVHCEKPIALTWGEARKMVHIAAQYGTRVTFNHQRRFGFPLRQAREIVRSGAIGPLTHMEARVGDLYDGGTHWIDLLSMFNEETPAEWVIGQIDVRQEKLAFGAPLENQAICHVKYRNGVTALIMTGSEVQSFGPPFRLQGTRGVVEVGWGLNPGPMLRYRSDDMPAWEVVDTQGEHLHGPGYIERAIADVVNALKTGGESELSIRRAINGTEIIFACYESSRRRARIDLPLDIDDSPIVSMIASGDLRPAPPRA
ncbi:MAG: Gfo/Idh/MocA family oxidoreductase [Chloroflexi bacterium]|nr:Gfo/Idh/MocA family oxidoreductase [Chloroflexota bacterium]